MLPLNVGRDNESKIAANSPGLKSQTLMSKLTLDVETVMISSNERKSSEKGSTFSPAGLKSPRSQPLTSSSREPSSSISTLLGTPVAGILKSDENTLHASIKSGPLDSNAESGDPPTNRVTYSSASVLHPPHEMASNLDSANMNQVPLTLGAVRADSPPAVTTKIADIDIEIGDSTMCRDRRDTIPPSPGSFYRTDGIIPIVAKQRSEVMEREDEHLNISSHGEISTEIDSEGAALVPIPLVDREEEPLCPTLAMSLPPASADIRRILATVGSNLLSVGSVVGLQAADAAVVVGAAVGIQAERVIMSTAQIVPRYSSQEMSKVITRKNALLDELSQSCMRLGLMEDKEKEMSLLIRELNLKEAELHERQLEEHTRANILESQLSEMSANTEDLRKENEMMSCQLQMIRSELSTETFINESLRAKVDEMQSLSDAQDVLLQQIRNNEDRAQQLLSDTTIELEATKVARERELEAVQSDIEHLIADQVALRAEMRVASEQSLAQLSGLS